MLQLLGPPPFRVAPFRDVAPGVGDRIAELAGANVEEPFGPLPVPALRVLEIVEDQRLAGLDRVGVFLDQSGGRVAGQGIEQSLADQLAGGPAVVCAGGLVRELIDEVHDPARLIANSAQDHEGVEQGLGGRAKAVLGFDEGELGAPPLGGLLERRQPKGNIAGELFEQLPLSGVEATGPIGVHGQDAVKEAAFVQRQSDRRAVSARQGSLAPRRHAWIGRDVVADDRALLPHGLSGGPFGPDPLSPNLYEIEVPVVVAEPGDRLDLASLQIDFADPAHEESAGFDDRPTRGRQQGGVVNGVPYRLVRSRQHEVEAGQPLGSIRVLGRLVVQAIARQGMSSGRPPPRTANVSLEV